MQVNPDYVVIVKAADHKQFVFVLPLDNCCTSILYVNYWRSCRDKEKTKNVFSENVKF